MIEPPRDYEWDHYEGNGYSRKEPDTRIDWTMVAILSTCAAAIIGFWGGLLLLVNWWWR